jgi:hypothetical protein
MVEVWVKGDPTPHARLKDLSFTGLSLLYPVAVPVGSILRVKSPQFEALVQVVACRAQAGQFSLHGQLLTLALDRTGRGVYVDAKASSASGQGAGAAAPVAHIGVGGQAAGRGGDHVQAGARNSVALGRLLLSWVSGTVFRLTLSR